MVAESITLVILKVDREPDTGMRVLPRADAFHENNIVPLLSPTVDVRRD